MVVCIEIAICGLALKRSESSTMQLYSICLLFSENEFPEIMLLKCFQK